MFKELLQRDTMLWLADTVQDALAKEVAEGDRAGRRGPAGRGPAEDQAPGTEDLTSADYAAALAAFAPVGRARTARGLGDRPGGGALRGGRRGQRDGAGGDQRGRSRLDSLEHDAVPPPKAHGFLVEHHRR